MSKQVIRLTEQELHEVVKNVTMQLINEMAVPLKFFKNRVDGLRLQLVENWCLCKYCQMYNTDNENFNHWITELRAHMDNIKSLNLKRGNKLSVLNQMLVEDYDFDDLNTVYRISIGKLNREGITNVNQISSVCKAFTTSIGDFVNALGTDTIITDSYLKDTFGV